MAETSLALIRGTLFPAPEVPADSVLIRGTSLAAVGTEERIRGLAGEDTRFIDVAGRAILPGFHDAHFHFLQSGLVGSRPDLGGCADRDELLSRVEAALEQHSGKNLLICENWDESAWADPSPPTRRDLDRLEARRPLLLRRVDGHTAVVNGAAAERLAPHAAPGELDAATGRCREGVVQDLDERFPPDAGEIRAAVARAARHCFARGITTTCDFLRRGPCHQIGDGLRDARCAVPDLDVYLWPECGPGERDALPVSAGFRRRGIKLFADGSVGARAAAVFDGYDDAPGETGVLFYTDDDLREHIRRGHEDGLQVAVHAIGDRAIAQVVAAFATLPAGEVRAAGHRIEHFELPRAEEILRVAKLGVRPCVQPNFVGNWAGPGGLYETALGPRRTRAMNPFRDLLRAGTGVFFGSDGMPASPLYGIRSAVGHPVAGQRLTVEESVRLYTEVPALAVSGDDRNARLREGATADLAVLPVPPGAIAADSRDEVDLTVHRGRVVHTSLALVGAASGC